MAKQSSLQSPDLDANELNLSEDPSELHARAALFALTSPLFRLIGSPSNYTEISLSDIDISDRNVDTIATVISCAKELKNLSICRIRISDFGMAKLLGAIKLHDGLETLCLGQGTLIGSRGALLVKILESNSTITTLTLSDIPIEEGLVHECAKALIMHPKLQNITFNHCNIGDAEINTLAPAISGSGTLQYIRLENNNIGDEGAINLANALKANSNIKQYVLKGNPIGDLGKAALAEALESNMIVTKIFGEEGMHGEDIISPPIDYYYADAINTLITRNLELIKFVAKCFANLYAKQEDQPSKLDHHCHKAFEHYKVCDKSQWRLMDYFYKSLYKVLPHRPAEGTIVEWLDKVTSKYLHTIDRDLLEIHGVCRGSNNPLNPLPDVIKSLIGSFLSSSDIVHDVMPLHGDLSCAAAAAEE